ncbi:hypothetical protein AB0K74_48760, partial [Streptomyces sp. NPDC056159]|uniref:hypothetical protein n=1 Tax=Streptomyces sp. NPDC056159 TaxID=3155537 RepID=UPI00343BD09B
KQIALDSYDRIVGLVLDQIAVDASRPAGDSGPVCVTASITVNSRHDSVCGRSHHESAVTTN